MKKMKADEAEKKNINKKTNNENDENEEKK